MASRNPPERIRSNTGSAIPSGMGGGAPVRAEINVTPMIDVMMSLLIIFMVVTPVLSGYIARLPDASEVRSQNLDDAVTMGIDVEGRFWVGEAEVPREQLEEELRSLYAERPGDHLLYLRADRDTPYSLVLDAIEAARTAGVRTVGALGTEIPAQEGEEGSRAP